MVDVMLMKNLMEALHPRTRLLFVGDKNQLPSVKAGAVLAEFIPEQTEETFSSVIKDATGSTGTGNSTVLTDRIILLDQNYRTAGRALEVAAAINRQDQSIIDTVPVVESVAALSGLPDEDTIAWIRPHENNYAHLKSTLRQFFERNYTEGHPSYITLLRQARQMAITEESVANQALLTQIVNHLQRVQILTLTRRGLYGSSTINSSMKELLALHTADGVIENSCFHGLPVIIHSNEYEKQLFNGDTGVILADCNNTLHAVFRGRQGFRFFRPGMLPAFSPCFAITVHKSQGSEYDRVMLVFPDDSESLLLSKEIVYTGITRAKSEVLLYGSSASIKKAVSRKIERESGIRLWD